MRNEITETLEYLMHKLIDVHNELTAVHGQVARLMEIFEATIIDLQQEEENEEYGNQ